MAYVSKENVVAKRAKLKELGKQYGMTGTLKRDNYTSMDYTIRKGCIDFGTSDRHVNEYHLESHRENNPKALEYLQAVKEILNE